MKGGAAKLGPLCTYCKSVMLMYTVTYRFKLRPFISSAAPANMDAAGP